MAHDIPITDRQRSLARHDISNLANAAGQWLEVETCDAMVTAVLNALAQPDPPATSSEDGQ